jgi:glycosyltransferase involved in cell wall biosynthesis
LEKSIKKGLGVSINSPIKVLHVISSLKRGGAEKWLVDMVGLLHDYGIVQKVIYFHTGPHENDIKALGVELILIRGLLFRYDPVFFMRLIAVIIREKPHIIHSSLWAANFIARIVGKILQIPVVTTHHSAIDYDSKLRILLDTSTHVMAAHQVYVSHHVKSAIHTKLQLKESSMSSIIQNGIDIDSFEQKLNECSVSRDQIGIPAQAFVVGAVGRFVEVKNFSFLLNVAAQLVRMNPLVYCILIGVGPLESELRSQARALGIESNVRFFIGEPAYKYYRVMDCFVQPSIQEGLSIALLEAMYAKLPCIVSAQNGNHEVIKDQVQGVICKDFALETYVDAIIDYKFNRSKARATGQRGHECVVNRHSGVYMVEQYFKIYTQLLSKRS